MSLQARLYGVMLLVVALLLQASGTLNAQDVAVTRPASASTLADADANNAPTLSIDEAKT